MTYCPHCFSDMKIASLDPARIEEANDDTIYDDEDEEESYGFGN